MEKLSAEILDLTNSLEFTQTNIDEELFQVRKEINNLKTEVKVIEDDLLNADEDLKEITFQDMENMWKKPQNIITDKLGIESDIEINHRIGPRKTKAGQGRDQPRTIF